MLRTSWSERDMPKAAARLFFEGLLRHMPEDAATWNAEERRT